MASRSVIKKAPQLHEKPEGERVILEGLQLSITISAEECGSLVRILENVDALQVFADECLDANNPQFVLGALKTYTETIQWMVSGGSGGRESLYVELNDRLRAAATGGQR